LQRFPIARRDGHPSFRIERQRRSPLEHSPSPLRATAARHNFVGICLKVRFESHKNTLSHTISHCRGRHFAGQYDLAFFD
jgi:hypothetical protein